MIKKYNIIICFIILLNFVVNVVIAQKNTLAQPSITSAKGPETTLPPSSEGSENSAESCVKSIECTSANDTLKLCDGLLKTPDKYIEENIRSGTYKPEGRSLSRCMCNQPYYDTLSTCLECFVNTTGTEFKISPIEEYKEECNKVGTTFTQTMPQITSGVSPKLKLGLIGGLVLVVVSIIGFIVYKRYKSKRVTDKHKISAEGSGNPSTSNNKYPPPQSPQAQYRYQYGEYTPPSDTPYYPPPPGGQEGQYPPPPPPPQQHGVQGGQGGQYPPPPQQHGGGQGGQSDSYYDSF